MAQSLDGLDGKKVFLVDVGFANSDNFMAQLHGWFEEHRPAIKTEIVRWRDQHARSRALRAHPGRGRRGHHRRRHLTGLCAGGLRPRRRHGVHVRHPDRRGARSRIRTTRAQHCEVAGHAERAAGVRPDAADEHVARGAAGVRRGKRPDPRPAVHGRGVRPAHASIPSDELRGGLGPVDRALRRGRERGGDARALPRAPLHRLPADHPAHRGARRGDACRNESRTRRDGREDAPDDRHGVLALRRREGRRERRDGRRRAEALRSSSRLRRAATPGARAACPRWGTWSSSTARSATRSA